jgi:hypothetical protein
MWCLPFCAQLSLSSHPRFLSYRLLLLVLLFCYYLGGSLSLSLSGQAAIDIDIDGSVVVAGIENCDVDVRISKHCTIAIYRQHVIEDWIFFSAPRGSELSWRWTKEE